MKRVNKSCSSYEDECNSMLRVAENRKKLVEAMKTHHSIN